MARTIAWFEDRGPKCALLVYIEIRCHRSTDGASLHRYRVEPLKTTIFHSTRRYLEQHGKPVAFYSGHNRTRCSGSTTSDGHQVATVSNAVRQTFALNNEILNHRYPLCQHARKAKGRVERAQQDAASDRLVKGDATRRHRHDATGQRVPADLYRAVQCEVRESMSSSQPDRPASIIDRTRPTR